MQKRGTTAIRLRSIAMSKRGQPAGDNPMMKALFATTAAVALAAGMSIAAAQGTGGTPSASGGTGAGGAGHGQMQKQGGTEKSGRASEGRGGSEKSERTGQKAGEKNEHMGQKAGEKNEHMGQKAGEKNERTGQKSEQKNERMGQKAGEKNERTGQKAGEKNEHMGQKAGEKNERTGEKNERTGVTEHGGAGSERITQAKSVHLSSDQRDRVKTIVTRNRSARVDRVDFDVRVGVRVPHTVHIVTLPEEIVRIVPQYRGFDYVIVRNEILIIDPDTYEIVAVLPA
jgi:hypothetical protein